MPVFGRVWNLYEKHFAEFLQKPCRIFSSSKCPLFSGTRSTSDHLPSFNPKSLHIAGEWIQSSVLFFRNYPESRHLVPATATEGFTSPAIAPTLAAEEGLFPPRLHCFLLRQVCLGGGIKSMQVLFLGLSLRFSGFNCDLVSPCRAQERVLDPQAAARNAWSAGASESGLHPVMFRLCWGLRNNGILVRRVDTG